MEDFLIPIIQGLLERNGFTAEQVLAWVVAVLGVTQIVGPLLNRFIPWARSAALTTETEADDRFVSKVLVPVAEVMAWLNAFLPRLQTGFAKKEARPRLGKGSSLCLWLAMLMMAMGCGSLGNTPVERAQSGLVMVAAGIDAADRILDPIAGRRVRRCLQQMRNESATDTAGYDACMLRVTRAVAALDVLRDSVALADNSVLDIDEHREDVCGALNAVLVNVRESINQLEAIPEAREAVGGLAEAVPVLARISCDAIRAHTEGGDS